MDNTSNFIISIIVVVLFCFGLVINASINTGIRFAECKVELAKQTKLDTANIIAICSEVYGK
jgi:uncharacterized membrane protein YciS (DUF1049 family)